MRRPRGWRLAPSGGVALRGVPGSAERVAVRRGVRTPHRGYDPAALPTRPAVVGVSTGGAIVHDIPGPRAAAAGDVARLDFGVAFGGCLAVRGEHETPLTDRGSGESAREMER